MNIFSNIPTIPVVHKLYERALSDTEKSMITQCKFFNTQYGPKIEFTFKSPADNQLKKHSLFLDKYTVDHLTLGWQDTSIELDKIKVITLAYFGDNLTKYPDLIFRIKYNF